MNFPFSLAALSMGGILLFASIGGVLGWLLRARANHPQRAAIGGILFGVWLFLFTQAPIHIAIASGVDEEAVPLSIIAGGLVMLLLLFLGVPRKLPFVGGPLAEFLLASERWRHARAEKRFERLERDLTPRQDG